MEKVQEKYTLKIYDAHRIWIRDMGKGTDKTAFFKIQDMYTNMTIVTSLFIQRRIHILLLRFLCNLLYFSLKHFNIDVIIATNIPFYPLNVNK